jgi:hypothetical protein
MKLTKFLSLALLTLVAVVLTGCKPPNIPLLQTVEPNETAWLIPLDGSSGDGQVKFDSVGFLNTKKIAQKRITISQTWRRLGYSWQWYAGEYIPTARLIKVDRRLITREWVDREDSKQDEGIPVNTRDNIGLSVGLTITMSISEEDASTYLYYHGQRALSEVADQNVKSYAVAELNRQISALNLLDFQNNQTQIYADLFKQTAATFKEKGITIDFLGNAKGWKFVNDEIQRSINASFIAQQDNKTAKMEQEAQQTRNATLQLNKRNENEMKVLTAQAEVDAANKLAQDKEAASFQNDLIVKLNVSKAQLTMAEKWDGKLPANILPEGSSLLMDFGKK